MSYLAAGDFLLLAYAEYEKSTRCASNSAKCKHHLKKYYEYCTLAVEDSSIRDLLGLINEHNNQETADDCLSEEDLKVRRIVGQGNDPHLEANTRSQNYSPLQGDGVEFKPTKYPAKKKKKKKEETGDSELDDKLDEDSKELDQELDEPKDLDKEIEKDSQEDDQDADEQDNDSQNDDDQDSGDEKESTPEAEIEDSEKASYYETLTDSQAEREFKENIRLMVGK